MKKDRDVFEATTAKITSIKTVVSLEGNQSFKGRVRGHVSDLNSNVDKLKKCDLILRLRLPKQKGLHLSNVQMFSELKPN